MPENNIGKMALVGDVWYEIMNHRISEDKDEYFLYSKDYWVPSEWIKEIKDNG